MAAPYYTHSSGRPNDQTRALAAIIRDELDLIADSFDLLPIPAAVVSGLPGYAVDTGTADAYAVTASPLIVAYSDGMTLRIKATNANTGASTLNVNALGLRSIVRPDGTSLAANDIYPGQIIQVSYNATTSQWQLALTALAAVYQAQAFATAAGVSAGAAAGSATAASGSASSASSSAVLAGQWATSLVLVDGSFFGARKYAIDASASASSASTSASNAATSETNAAASAVLAAQTFNGTSTTSLTVGVATQNLTTQTGKSWVLGQRVSIARTSNPAIVMYGAVAAYNSGTGALQVSVDRVIGTGTYSDWTIGLSGANGASLPTQTGQAGKLLTTDGTTESWTNTPTVASLNGGQLAGARNRVRNGAFLINQRVVSGSVILASGAYGHDGWKGGASGCTYTFASSGGITTLTITAGTLLQVVDGVDLFTGTHVLSWAGTAQGRIAAGSYSASGVTGSVTGGSNLNVEFGTGTLSLVQLEPGTTATPFEHEKFDTYLRHCQRHFCKSFDYTVAPAASTGALGGAITVSTQVSAAVNFVAPGAFPVTMRAVPTITTYNPSTAGTGWSASGAGNYTATLFVAGTNGVAMRCTTVVPSAESIMCLHYTASAEL